MTDSSGGSQRANRRLQLLVGLPLSTEVPRGAGKRDASGHLLPAEARTGGMAEKEAAERSAVVDGAYGLGKRRTKEAYRKWSGIDTGTDPRPTQGQCTDHSWVPWETPHAHLATKLAAKLAAEAAAAASAYPSAAAAAAVQAAGMDALWPLDGMGWPPPLEVHH
jgi:hypothetical protein